MHKKTIVIAGIGPGDECSMTSEVVTAIRHADVIIGYKYYFQFIQKLIPEDVKCIDTGMKRERERAQIAFECAEEGKNVCIISSGDAGIYGMSPLIYEMKRERDSDVQIMSFPGISAFQKAASILGAPMGHDFCVISMSDLMTPWQLIERRIKAAAQADFVTAIYNPKSENRYWQLYRLKEIFLKEGRSPQTPVGYVRQAGRKEEQTILTSLDEFNPEDIDMFTIVIIGNSQSYNWKGKFITPRGYYREKLSEDVGVGQKIMIESFQTIASELRDKDIPLSRKWPLIHAIHTTADFEMENLLYTDRDAVPILHDMIKNGKLKTIVTDVTMVVSGIRKAPLDRYGIDVKCYLSDERTSVIAAGKNITRTQAGIRIAVEENPDALFVFGNAPTALIELCSLIRSGKAHPVGIIAAPVGFVHVCESKYRVKTFSNIPKLIIEGRKGGSNLAATLVNSILSYDDAEQLKPGRDV